MNKNITFKVKLPIYGTYKIRLDKALSILLSEYSRSVLKNWILNNQVLINGNIINKPDLILKNCLITVFLKKSEELIWKPENVPLDIIFEDKDILVINKPSGLVVHPGSGNLNRTMLNGLIYRFKKNILIPRAGIVHRLDKNTTGLLVVAKTLQSYLYLTKQLKLRKIIREYLAFVKGNLLFSGTISKPIKRHPIQRTKMAINDLGKIAITHYNVLKNFDNYTYLRIRLETGRTHQIRVHMSYINHPIVGDSTYCGKYSKKIFNYQDFASTFNRQALHASTIQLIHPINRKVMRWTIPIPNDMKNLFKNLK